MNEHLDYNIPVKTLADAANRALGAVINKYKSINGLGYYTFTRMFHSGICPILDYCSETWGFKNYAQIDSIQNKAIRIFLGVHRFAPLAAINGDIGWTNSRTRRHISILRLWNRIVQMEEDRLPRIVLNWDRSFNRNNWSSELKAVLRTIEQDVFNNFQIVNILSAWSMLHEKHCLEWKQEIDNKPKLRTYRIFKNNFEAEPYVISFLSRGTRSCIAQFRCGILPLAIETGRWSGLQYDNRICKICNGTEVENEYHFIFHCNFYDRQRDDFYRTASQVMPEFVNFSEDEKIRCCMSKVLINAFSHYIHCIFNMRQRSIYM